MEKTAAVDFETYYQKTRYSTRIQGPRGYVDHPEFDAYLVSIATSDGGEFVGPPSEFDFNEIADYVWLSHNRGFDFLVYQKLLSQGKTSGPKNPVWHCTADLASYLGYPRALGPVLHLLYGVELDKGIRDRMSGQKWSSLSLEEKEAVSEYAMEDVRYLNRFWQDYSLIWPEHERRISDMTMRMKNAGVPIDAVKLDQSIRHLQKRQFEIEEAIPWYDRNDPKEKAKTPLSPKSMAAACRALGLPVPSSRAKGDAAAEAWIAEHGEKAPFMVAMRDWNGVNSLLKKLLTLRERVIFPEEDDFAYQHLPADLRDGNVAWCPYGMKYFGAHTGRDSGSEGLNVLNMHRGEVSGVDFRSHIAAPKGYKFISADYSQIEPRVLAWLAEDHDFIAAVREGADPYVAFGLKTLGHQGDWSKQDRQVWKMMVLSLGYQAGAEKFKGAAKSMGGLEITIEEAKRLVQLYRRKNRKVADPAKGFWTIMEKSIRAQSKTTGGSGTATVTLPSGRTITYRNVVGRSSLTADMATESGYRKSHLYGGLLCLAGDTQVLTDRGWVQLLEVSRQDFVFDGQSWVEHEGVVFRGNKLTYSYSGVWMTPDHRVLSSKGWEQAQLTNFEDAKKTFELVRNGVWEFNSHVRTPRTNFRRKIPVGLPMWVRSRGSERRSRVEEGYSEKDAPGVQSQVPPSSHPSDSWNDKTPSVRSVVQYESPVSARNARGLSQLRGKRYFGMPRLARFVREFLARHGGLLPRGLGIGSHRQRWKLRAEELPMGDEGGELQQSTDFAEDRNSVGKYGSQSSFAEIGNRSDYLDLPSEPGGNGGRAVLRPVYDILSAGPLKRFTVRGDDGRPFIVHNCENTVQACSRDIFFDGYLRLADEGLYTLLRIYDEVLLLVPESKAEEARELTEKVMSKSPEWASDLPIAAEAEIIDYYKK